MAASSLTRQADAETTLTLNLSRVRKVAPFRYQFVANRMEGDDSPEKPPAED